MAGDPLPTALRHLLAQTRALRCPVGTVRSRLARGREALRSRLVGRDLPIITASVPAGLVDATLKAALSDGAEATTRVLELAEEALRQLGLAKIKCTLAVLLVVGVLAGATGLLVGRHPPPDKQPVKRTAAARSLGQDASSTPGGSGRPRLDVSGRVLTTTGQPVPGARVYLREWTLWRQEPAGDDVLASARTDERGEFSFQGVYGRPFALPWQTMQHPWEVVVLSRGRAVAWRHLTPQVRQAGPLTFHLAPAAPLRGRVLDTAGMPVAGAEVRVDSMQPLSDPATASPPWRDSTLHLRHSRVVLRVRSDAEGRFTLDGLPPGMRVRLNVSSPAHMERSVLVATADGPQPSVVTESYHDWQRYLQVEPVLSGDCLIELHPGRLVRGRVIAADTGRPVPGARLRSWAAGTTADAQGRFTLGPLPLGRCTVCAYNPGENDLLKLMTQVEASQQGGEPELTFRLPRGIVVAGRAVDEDSGQLIAGVEVRYQEQGKLPYMVGILQTRTNAEGRFHLTVPAGQGKLTASGSSSGYHQVLTRAVNVQRGRPPDPITFAFQRDAVVRGRVLSPQGRGVKGAEVHLEQATAPGFPNWSCVTADDGAFTLGPLPPWPDYEWVVTHPVLRLGARLPQAIPSGRKEPLRVEVKLAPLGIVSGRALDEKRSPLAGAVVRIVVGVRLAGQDKWETEMEVATLTADSTGRFRFDRILPGPRHRFRVEVAARGHVGVRSTAFEVRPGQTKVLGDLVLPAAGPSLSGTVLGGGGQPLADVRIKARPSGTGATGVSLVWPGPVVTARDGRFQVAGLPNGAVELEAELCVAGMHDASKPAAVTRVKVEAARRQVPVVIRLHKR
jgi:protocatechuate 3,4-dioxygenase beta subunit